MIETATLLADAKAQTGLADFGDSDWILSTDHAPAFRDHKRLMQLLQQHNGGRWTFKNPWHPLFLNALTGVYPDAQLVMTRRDPADVVASACSLVYAVCQLCSHSVDPRDIAVISLKTFDAMIQRTIAFHDKHGRDAIHHVQDNALTADPIGTMRTL